MLEKWLLVVPEIVSAWELMASGTSHVIREPSDLHPTPPQTVKEETGAEIEFSHKWQMIYSFNHAHIMEPS